MFYSVNNFTQCKFLGRNPEARGSDRAHEDRGHVDRQPSHPGEEGRLLHKRKSSQTTRLLPAAFHKSQQPTGQPKTYFTKVIFYSSLLRLILKPR